MWFYLGFSSSIFIVISPSFLSRIDDAFRKFPKMKKTKEEPFALLMAWGTPIVWACLDSDAPLFPTRSCLHFFYRDSNPQKVRMTYSEYCQWLD